MKCLLHSPWIVKSSGGSRTVLKGEGVLATFYPFFPKNVLFFYEYGLFLHLKGGSGPPLPPSLNLLRVKSAVTSVLYR